MVPFRASLAVVMLALVMLAQGCALRRDAAVTVTDWDARSAQLRAIDTWQVRGRIALKSADGGAQGDLRWDQQGERSQIRVSGPFGAGRYDISWDRALLSVDSRDGEFSRAYTGPDAAEQFLAEQIGWSFPADSVRHWLLGLPDPEFPVAETRDAAGRPSSLVQNGWTVTYQRFTETAGTLMPQRLTLASDRARVRLVLDHWCLGTACAGSR
jgi:outer membrane lipoprotein LolB